MPVKWDARTDQILLLKILETSQVSADVKAISDAWPTEESEKPTPRAITERLAKIRKEVKGSTGSFKVSGASRAIATSDVTPQKRAPRGSKSGSASAQKKGSPSNAKKTTNGGKRKNMSDEYAVPSSSSSSSSSSFSSCNSLLDFDQLPPPDPAVDEDARTVPASAELYEMLIRYGVVPRDDESVDADDRSQTMMPDGENDVEDVEATPRQKKAKKSNGAGGKVKVEEEAEGEFAEEAYGQVANEEYEYEDGFAVDGAGDYSGGAIFA